MYPTAAMLRVRAESGGVGSETIEPCQIPPLICTLYYKTKTNHFGGIFCVYRQTTFCNKSQLIEPQPGKYYP
jgi:hypothetical protein